MNCELQRQPDNPRDGRERWKCRRSGCKIDLWVPAGNKVRSECRGAPLPHELGHWLALFLEAFGITKDRYQAAKRIVGLNPSCGCANREQKLNTLGQRFGAWLRRV